MLQALEPVPINQDDSETLSENVFRRIQAAIVKGEIAPGSKISEPELARTYGISRGPLREAIHRLEGQRLLVRVPHVGARVVSLSHAELIELYEIRESLEGMACRLAAERIKSAIDQLGYIRNEAAGGLASTQGRIVGAIVPSVSNSIFAETIQGLSTTLSKHNYQLLLATHDYSIETEEKVVRAFLGWSPRALVLTGADHSTATETILVDA